MMSLVCAVLWILSGVAPLQSPCHEVTLSGTPTSDAWRTAGLADEGRYRLTVADEPRRWLDCERLVWGEDALVVDRADSTATVAWSDVERIDRADGKTNAAGATAGGLIIGVGAGWIVWASVFPHPVVMPFAIVGGLMIGGLIQERDHWVTVYCQEIEPAY